MTIIYVTKRALTEGIAECHYGAIDQQGYATGVVVPGYRHTTCLAPSEFRTTKAEAIARAEQMRTAKIASLRKQIARLEAMTFEVPE